MVGRGRVEKQNPAKSPEDPWHPLTTGAKDTHLSEGFLSKVIRQGDLRAALVGIGKQRHHYLLRQSCIDAWIESRASGGSARFVPLTSCGILTPGLLLNADPGNSD